jgi:predicted nucleic acid-binding protein
MGTRRFIDTNVFVYHLDPADAHKHAIADRIVRDALRSQDACISYQVAQEFLNVVTSKARVPLSAHEAQAYLDAVLAPLMQIGASADLLSRALAVRARWRFGFYDALIVAAALSAGCGTLLTEDLQHGQCIESLTVVDPFRI